MLIKRGTGRIKSAPLAFVYEQNSGRTYKNIINDFLEQVGRFAIGYSPTGFVT